MTSISKKNENKLDTLIALTENHLKELKDLEEGSPKFAQEIHKFHKKIIKLDSNPIYHEKIIYSEEDKAGFITKEEFFKDESQ